jgi:hypothetical protein
VARDGIGHCGSPHAACDEVNNSHCTAEVYLENAQWPATT